MKQIVSIFRAALLIAVLASLAVCSGSFIDPGQVDGIVSMGGGDFGGGFDGGGGGGGGGGVSKPDPLPDNATYEQAIDKLDEIIEYCEDHPGTMNDVTKNGAEMLKPTISSVTWDSMGSTVIPQINSLIIGLQ
jgi:hypothetical protein